MRKLMDMMKQHQDQMSDKDVQAKLEVLKELIEMADGKEGQDYKDGLDKVTVAAPDKQGLKEGLKKAQDMLEKMPGDKRSIMQEALENEDREMDTMDDMENQDDEENSPEPLDEDEESDYMVASKEPNPGNKVGSEELRKRMKKQMA